MSMFGNGWLNYESDEICQVVDRIQSQILLSDVLVYSENRVGY
jgi:hypothetical protein